NTIDLGDVFDTASVEGIVRKIAGKIENVDVYVKGDYTRPVVSGKLELALLSYEQFSLKEAPVDFNLQLKDIFKDIKLNGKVNVTRGNILSRRTKVQLEESYLVFEGAPVNPRFNIRGKSDIEKTKINISVKGTKEDPDLWLSSEPPLPKEQLMVMLATGKRWKGVETSLKNEQLSDEVADDFVDYFLFSGQGKKLAEHFGIKELSITYTQDTRGLGVKKSLTDKLDIGYGVEKSVEQNKEEPSRIKQKLEGEYNLNEKLSIGVQKEIMYDNKDTVEEQEVPEPVADDRVFMKFKTKF
ncbi:MAG: translocation/assembly module TamB domain-containing protein, partial [Candidatus Omnitrophica bacterium]|nr:translocation/assembly module TamB domain-containing protein [Candidatus Omnitrophota bacterium]